MAQNLKTTVCDCGEKLSVKNITSPIVKNKVHGFYGGRVTHFAKTTCQCGKCYKLYLRPFGGSWEVIDMEEVKEDENFGMKKKKGK